MPNDGVEVLELGPPIERRTNAGNVGHQDGRIARSPSRHLDREIRPAHLLDRIDHLQHRGPAPVAAIEGRAGAAAPQIVERRRMRLRQIADMDVVADAGAVWRRIVGAEHLDLVALADRRFAGDLDQMRGRGRRLAGALLADRRRRR